MDILYQNIKMRREALGLSQDELAQKVGYTSRSSIAKIENGCVDIPRSKIVAFAQALQCTPMELMGWDEPDEEDAAAAKTGLPAGAGGLDPETLARFFDEGGAQIIYQFVRLDERGRQTVKNMLGIEYQRIDGGGEIVDIQRQAAFGGKSSTSLVTREQREASEKAWREAHNPEKK